MRILGFIIIGMFTGWLANLQLGGKTRQTVDVLSGALGGVIAGCASLFVKPVGAYSGFAWDDIVIAVAGAMTGVFVHRVSRTKRSTSGSMRSGKKVSKD